MSDSITYPYVNAFKIRGITVNTPIDKRIMQYNATTKRIEWVATGSGAGDMILASVQSVTGLKTFDTTKIAVKGSSTGTTAIASANASATDYTATLPAKTGTVAMTSDITATLWTTWNASKKVGVTTTITSNSVGDDLTPGTGVRFSDDEATWQYAKVLSVATRDHLLLGHEISAAEDLYIEYDASGTKTDIETIQIPDNFNDADDATLLVSDLNMALGYRPALSGEYYLVGIVAYCKSADTSTDPTLNIVEFGGSNAVFSAAIDCDLTRHTTTNTAVAAYYACDLDSDFDLSVLKVGAGDAYDLFVEFHFVRA